MKQSSQELSALKQYINEQNNKDFSLFKSLSNQFDFYEKCKKATLPKMRHELENDAHFQYYRLCHREMDLAINILDKIRNKTLYLFDFTVSSSQKKALAAALRYFRDHAHSFLLDNCGFEDHEFAEVLASIQSIPETKSITYRRNELGVRSAA